jgi:hypothetical protein
VRRVLFAVFFAAVLFGSVVPAGLAEDLPRHRDPLDFGPEPPNMESLSDLYGFVFNWTMVEDYSMALSWLDFSGFVFAPAATKSVMDRFTTLFGSAIGDLNLTKSDIEMIKAYLRRLKLDEAEAAIGVALARLDGANATVGSMDLTVLDLAAILKGSPQELLAGDEGLRALIEKYRLELLALLEQHGDLSKPGTFPGGILLPNGNVLLPNGTIITFIQTYLAIEVSPMEALVGSSVLVRGSLTDSSGLGLASRGVNVFIDNDVAGVVYTDESGSFVLTLGVPYLYRDHVTVSAQYRGEVLGNSVYLPCSSNDVEVELIYYTPVISIDMPQVVYPGKVFAVSGVVGHDGVGVDGLAVEVIAFGSLVHLTSGDGGRFSAVFSVPSGSPEGLAGVGVYSSPRDVFGPAGFVGYVDVVRVPLSLSVDYSSWTVSGLPFRVSGSVFLDGVPVSNCTVRLGGSVGGSEVATGVDGRFESEVALPFSLFTADYSFNVKAYASEPWVKDSSVGGEVFVVNIVTLVAGPVLLGGVVYYGSKRLRGYRRPRRRVAPPTPMEDGPVATPVPAAEAEAEAGPVSVRGAYGSAVELVVKRTGVEPRPSETLREYLDATEGGLGVGARVFRSLTLMFERWLYGGSEVKLGVVDRLLMRLRRLFS